MCRGMWLRGLELAWFSFVGLEVGGLVDLFLQKRSSQGEALRSEGCGYRQRVNGFSFVSKAARDKNLVGRGTGYSGPVASLVH
jgi:hypothetical protein